VWATSGEDIERYMSQCKLAWYETTSEAVVIAVVAGIVCVGVLCCVFCCCFSRWRCFCRGPAEKAPERALAAEVVPDDRESGL